MLEVLLNMTIFLKKVQSPLTNRIVHDIETSDTIKCVNYASNFCKLSKSFGKYLRDKREKDHQNCSNSCIVFKQLDNFNEMLDYVLQFREEADKIKKRWLIIVYTKWHTKDLVLIHILY